MRLLLTAALLVLVSCGSTTEKKESQDPAADVGLTNNDFTKQKPLSYSASQDHYATPKGSTGALITESASKANNTELKSMTAGSDQLANMMTFCYKRQYEEAFAIADKLFSTHMNIPTYWNQIATCHLLQGNERKALLFYNKALEVTPQYVPALNNIAVIYNKTRQDQKAQVALQRALAQGRFSKTPRYNLAYLLLNYGLASKAYPLFKGLLDEAPGDVDVRVGVANSLALMSRWDEAWEQFNAIPDKRRKNSDVGLNMALTAHRLGKAEQAKAILSATDVESSDRQYSEAISGLIGE